MSEDRTIDLEASDLTTVLQILSQRVPDRDVFVFGSRVTGQARRRSDLDLAIEGKLTLRQRAELTDAFSESNLPIEVDFVDLAVLTPVFRRRIEQEWVPLVKGMKPVGVEQIAA